MASDIVTRELEEPIDVAEYLFQRLRQMGIKSIHGVPGDYNLGALDYIPKCGLHWVGNCNELNAGYAADGYARINGISALFTTFGVGELSALNAIAGAYSEYVPIVHIVGQPSTASQKDGMLLHHTLGNGDFNVFANMSAGISCSVAKLNDPRDAAAYIDSTLKECWVRSRPVYITLPIDMVKQKIEGKRLKTPIDLQIPDNDQEKEDYVVDTVLKYLHAAKRPAIIVDACAIRHKVLDEIHDLVSKSGLPTFVAPMGKGAVDETLPNYGGVYAGDGSTAQVREHIEASDLILSIGGIKSDFNTTGFTYRVSRLNTIDFHSNYMVVRYSEYPGVRMKGVLRKVINRMGKLNITAPPKQENVPEESPQFPAPTITHSWLWPNVGNWLQENDIVITETGTSSFGIWGTRFPKGVTAVSQVLWGSIGYSLGACQGAALATKEKTPRRTILFIGDGSFQLTVQEISTMIRNELTPIIFVICNNGYTVERYIHGWKATYNDIQEWKFGEFPSAFGAQPDKFATYQIRERQELLDLFSNQEFCSAKRLQIVELHTPQEDAPSTLRLTAEMAAKRNE
ncbi:Pyruvate decarboxylase PdcA [Trichophyton interdigitale]|uniref:Pyruvate decarboxylase n=1 Tax=Trichophyton interdigitale (strain MR816) TaxID=1215338 RepID=A0A059J422_TRIIM|nr:pyruvate decarboxylase [Trichophyton interdigitale H6]KAG5208013.1 Pyruvate decarboxylase PdcA [Trichophyton interdigitale]KAG5217948.1 Pyruvate decarboxylase PdcA [Trichophyton interdigitale]KAG8206427.1 Pyruvate decarboxylase PdcA [Trichophyton interdigitale]KDB22600.1 pyruvate decarboxylase [Trichophyton interdigitale MR816]